jgi:hypothetical protein
MRFHLVQNFPEASMPNQEQLLYTKLTFKGSKEYFILAF